MDFLSGKAGPSDEGSGRQEYFGQYSNAGGSEQNADSLVQSQRQGGSPQSQRAYGTGSPQRQYNSYRAQQQLYDSEVGASSSPARVIPHDESPQRTRYFGTNVQ
eukprot:Hpha_TRINITY_DN15479_c6_g1::TRINITY_DN15479_c6_g1_i1::g.173314::m.173314